MYFSVQIRGEVLHLTAPTMNNPFTPLSFAFPVYMEAKIKLANVADIGTTFVNLLKTQGKLYGVSRTRKTITLSR